MIFRCKEGDCVQAPRNMAIHHASLYPTQTTSVTPARSDPRKLLSAQSPTRTFLC